ncbi:hypothetical protein PISMIDRAFT_11979 [Pisolithus microcarpus 441]|uniref:Unplaced genomic scaffold scaffold_62, whole genome shotgun sequence n=1 Tax=Pisolithus microcarpus 441 TaxID=765257 RepID=A0A0C9ZQ10_9AGAM|nr:hypothetical protein BKA83DRAFT_11979 [Pisolithus microcarpus]KIK21823.1 hypothetical protein PISMIDRAFT_11979 [Pisolithus microcarpus 441]
MDISSTNYILAAAIGATVPAVTLRLSTEGVKQAANDQQSAEVDSLIGPEINSNRYHISVARTHLTLNLGLYYPDIEDEVHTAFEELLIDNGAIDELLSFTTDTDTADSVEERSSSGNRTGDRMQIQQHLGSSSAHRFAWIDLNSRFAAVTTDANLFDIFPKFLVLLVSKKLPNFAAGIARAAHHLNPIIKECFRCAGEHEEDWSDKPAKRSLCRS